MPEGATRSLSAVWFADIVGYSALSEADEDAALSLVSELQAIVEREVPSRSGRIVKFLGDAALTVFESAGQAVEAALRVRDAFQESSVAQELGAVLRVGVHVGEIVTAADGDVYGDGVNAASRIQSAAEPGQVLLSSFAVEGIRHRKDLLTAFQGQRKVKGLSRALDLFAVDWVGGVGSSRDPGAGSPALPAPGSGLAGRPGRWTRLAPAVLGASILVLAWFGAKAWWPSAEVGDTGVPVEEPTLAVLPPVDLSPAGDHAYLADGLHDEILHRLAQLPGIRLTSRTSSSFMRGVSATDAAESLGVRYILESSLRVAQDSLLLTVQLIDTFNDEHLWSQSLGRRYSLEGLFGLQQILAERVAASLSGTLISDPDADSNPLPTRSLEAYNEFLRGLYRLGLFDLEDIWEAADHFERATEIDPEFGRAHARLSLVLAILNNYGGVAQGVLFPRIQEHAELALQYAPDDVASRLALQGLIWPMSRDWPQARRIYEEVLAENPHHVEALWGFAEFHGVIEGNPERGLELLQEASRVDPFSPIIRNVRWWILFNARRFEEGVSELEALLEVDPSNVGWRLNLVSTLALAGRQEDARRLMDELYGSVPSPRPASLATHLTRAGDTVRAREVLRDAVARKESGANEPASGIAAGYAVLGEMETALDWLERSFNEEGGIYFLRNPDWDNVAHHPRFQALWTRVGLSGEHPARG